MNLSKSKIYMFYVGLFIINVLYFISMFAAGYNYNNDLSLESFLYEFGYFLCNILYLSILNKYIIKFNFNIHIQMKLRVLHILMGFIVGIVAYMVIISFRYLSDFIDTISFNKDITVVHFLDRLILIVLAVVVEEVICRKYLYIMLEKQYNSWLKATIISSIIFSVLHINSNRGLIDILFYFLFGCFLCMLVRKTKSVCLTIGIHTGWNLLSSQSIVLVNYLINNQVNLLISKLYNVILMMILCGIWIAIQNRKRNNIVVQ